MEFKFKEYGVLIEPGSRNFAEYKQIVLQAINASIERSISAGSAHYKNPSNLKIQLEQQWLLTSLVCTRDTGKTIEKQIQPNGDLYIAYSYPYSGSPLLFHLIAYNRLQSRIMKTSYVNSDLKSGQIYLQLYIKNSPQLSTEINNAIQYLFHYINHLLSSKNYVDDFNSEIINFINVKIETRIAEVKKLLSHINDIPEN